MVDQIDFKEKLFMLDGAYGTMLQQRGMPDETCPESLNITNPALVKEIHLEYVNSGADILETNTFGANPAKLAHFRLQKQIHKINADAIRIARSAAAQSSNENILVAGTIGPLGRYCAPLGDMEFEEAYENFAKQIKSLNQADFLLFQTFDDIRELKAAIIACKENSEKQFVCSMSMDNGRTTTGTDVMSMASILKALGASAIGLNCSVGPEVMIKNIERLTQITNLPVWVEPNAGIPKLVDGKTIFTSNPAEFAEYARRFAQLGCNVIGGCCGTTPAHINKVVHAIKGLRPTKRYIVPRTTLSSRSKTITIGNDSAQNKVLIAGERINPTNKKEMTEQIKKGKTNLIRTIALKQKQEKADLVDINIGVADIDESKFIRKAVEAVQNSIDCPIIIDTSDPVAMEQALKQCNGKPLLNSVNGSEESLQAVLPLAKKYGAAILGLCIDERGIPKTIQQKIEIGEKIAQKAKQIGIAKEDIVFDPLTMTVATDQKRALETLEAIKIFKSKGYRTILGVSNVSHGLPKRRIVNATFLKMAKKAGLDIAIYNPAHVDTQGDDHALRLLQGQDKGAHRFIEYAKTLLGQNKPQESRLQEIKPRNIAEQISLAIVQGDEDNIIDLIDEALQQKQDPMQINSLMIKGLDEVGRKFKAKEYYLPQVILSASAMRIGFTRLKKELKKKGENACAGTIIVATVKNDVHDIGKNILCALLETNNFRVIDMGKNIDGEAIVKRALETRAAMIALSALMTTTIKEMPKVATIVKQRALKIPIIIGGAVCTEEFAQMMRCDYPDVHYANDAMEGVIKCHSVMKEQSRSSQKAIVDKNCFSCTDCNLPYTAGLCPVRRCSKSLTNGPCGGTINGKCEVSPEQDCVWVEIFNRLEADGKTELIERYTKPKKHLSNIRFKKQALGNKFRLK